MAAGAAAQMSEELYQVLQAARESGDRLEDLTLEHTVVEQADFSELTCRNVHLHACRFLGCDFSGASFYYARFQNCQFESCRLSRSYWQRVLLDGCKADGADFRKARFKSCRLEGGRFRYGNYVGTVWDRCTVYKAESTKIN